MERDALASDVAHERRRVRALESQVRVCAPRPSGTAAARWWVLMRAARQVDRLAKSTAELAVTKERAAAAAARVQALQAQLVAAQSGVDANAALAHEVAQCLPDLQRLTETVRCPALPPPS